MNFKLTIGTLPVWSLALVLLLSCSDSGSASSAQSSKLSPPTIVSVNFVDVNTLEVSWSEVSSANEYEVYIDDNADVASPSRFDIVEAGDDTSTNATDLTASSQYWFVVKACYSSPLDCSDFSNATLGETIPSDIAPSDFSATPGIGSVTLTWTAVDGYSYDLLRTESDCIASLEDLDNYSTHCSDYEPFLVNDVSSGLVQEDLNAGTTYYYWLDTTDVNDNRSYATSSTTPLSTIDVDPGVLIFSEPFSSGVDLAVALDEQRSIVYVVSDSELYALDANEGYEKWSFEAVGAISSSPLIDAAGGVYITAITNAGNVVSKVDSEGNLQWSSSEDGALDGAGLQDAIALIENDSGGYLYFVNGSGEIFSSSDLSRTAFQELDDVDGGAVGAMAIDLYQNLYFGDSAGNLNVLSANNAVDSVALDATIVTALAVDGDQNIYFSAGNRVYSYDSLLAQRWRSNNTIGSISSSPVLAAEGGALYQAGGDALYKFATNNGDAIWSYELDGRVGDTAPVVDENGNIYLGLSRDGEVAVVSGDGELIDTYSTGKSAGVNTPLRLSSAGIIYFGAGDWLFAIKAEAATNTQSPWSQYKGNVRGTAFVGDSEAVDASGTYARAELDNEDLTFAKDSGGNTWVIDDRNRIVGSSSMRSPSLEDNELACISTSTNQDGNLSFWWKVSSEQGYDLLSLSITSSSGAVNKAANISGSVDWQQIDPEILVNADDEIKWCYQKDFVNSNGSDAGWLDNVQIN